MGTLDKLSENDFTASDHGVRNQFVCSEKRSRYALSLDPKMEGWRYQVEGTGGRVLFHRKTKSAIINS